MISVIDLGIRAHEPYARVVLVTFCGVTVIPLAVELYEEPEMDLAVELRITVDPHILDTGNVQQHLAAGIINVAVTAVLREASVCGMFIVPCTRKEPEPKVVMYPVEDIPCGCNIILAPETGHYFPGDGIRITVAYVIGSVVSAASLVLGSLRSYLDLYGRFGSTDIAGLVTGPVYELVSAGLCIIDL